MSSFTTVTFCPGLTVSPEKANPEIVRVAELAACVAVAVCDGGAEDELGFGVGDDPYDDEGELEHPAISRQAEQAKAAGAMSFLPSTRAGVVISRRTALNAVGFNRSPNNVMNHRVQAYVSQI